MRAIWRGLTKVAILLSLLLHQSLQACNTGQAPFPKIVGGTQSDTIFDQIDYNQVTDYLVAAGYTNDQGVRGDALGNTARPIIIAYQYNDYKWGKVFTSLVNQAFNGVKINRLGTKIVVANAQTTRYLIVMDITDGNVITATQFTTSAWYEFYRRNLLLLDNENILMGDNTRIVKVAPPSTSAPTYTRSGYSIIGLQTNTAQSYLHAFAYASSICMITVMDMATFTRVYQYQAQCAATSAANLAQTFQTSSTVDTIVFQEGARFFKINNQYSPPSFTTSTVHDPAATSLSGRGLHCASNELVYSLMRGDYSTDSYRIFVATVNFNTNKITYQRYLQQVANGEVYHGVIISDSKFYLGGYTDSIRKTTSTSFSTRSSKYHGIIYSPMLTCQSVEQYTYPDVTLSVDGFTLTPTINDYTSQSLTVTDLSSSLPTTSDIISTEFEGQYAGSCSIQLPVAPLDYSSLSSTQAISTFTYMKEQPTVTIPITSFTAAIVSSAADPVYTYSLDTYYQAPNGITITASTGAIVISSPSTLGVATHSVSIVGKLQDCQTIKALFTLIGYANTAPSFYGIVGYELPGVTVEQEQTTTPYPLPTIVDPNLEQTITITLIDGGSSAYPTFIDFTDPSKTEIKIEPTSSTAVGTYLVQVQLYDGIATATYTLNIMVEAMQVAQNAYIQTNSGPPVFASSLEIVNVKAGNTVIYTLPSKIDPDENDSISIAVYLQQATPFTKYDSSSLQFTFSPQIGTKYSKQYEITIELADNNINPKRNQYKLTVQVEQEQENKQNKNKTDDEIIDAIINSKDKKVYKCGIKIVQVGRNGQMQLKIASSSSQHAAAIAQELKDSYIQVHVDEQTLTVKIEDVLEGNILSIKLEFINSAQISTGMVRIIIINLLGIGLSSSKNLEVHSLRNWNWLCLPPKRYDSDSSNSNSILTQPRAHRIIATEFLRKHTDCGTVYQHRSLTLLWLCDEPYLGYDE
ncbi:hypothetical protein FGO68_gene11316 [Halteria grandinella]|uniref:Cadherin domain-containing protein n=1 Tax=Halteria grandinella TaxID=5974 RepID=A0A8J8P5U8_HALGN|nr:hypothetical protein FGO68_gene11316 [Halteria grandinella]